MPPKFAFPIREVAVGAAARRSAGDAAGAGPALPVVGRLKAGVSVAQASAQLATIAAQLEQEFPATNSGVGADVMPYAKTVLGPEIYAMLYTMLGAGIGVLLIACVNVSNLLVARASLRRREVAVRMALGAARSRVVRQHLTEVLVLATAGAVLGILLSLFGMRWFTEALSVNPPPFWITFELDYRVMLFVLGLIVLSSLFAGGLPALHAARVSAGAVLKDDSRSSTSARFGRFSSGLVVAELAVSCGLLIAAGLMIKSVVQLRNVTMPFAIETVLTARVDLPRDRLSGFAGQHPLLRAAASPAPGGAGRRGGDAVRRPAGGRQRPHPRADRGQGLSAGRATIRWRARGSSRPATSTRSRRRCSSGREFNTGDTATGQPVAIVNESFARTHFPGVDPVGHQFKRIRPAKKEPWMTIVGVVPDLMMEGIGNNNASPVGYYIPIAQSDVANGVRIAVRTRGDAAPLTPLVRSAVTSLDTDLAIYEVEHDAARDRPADLVLHDVRHVLHGVRRLRAAAGRGRTLRRDVVRGDAADARDGRALGARRAGRAADRAGDAPQRHPARHRPGAGTRAGAARVRRAAAGAVSRQSARRDGVRRRRADADHGQPAGELLPARRVARIDPVRALATE